MQFGVLVDILCNVVLILLALGFCSLLLIVLIVVVRELIEERRRHRGDPH